MATARLIAIADALVDALNVATFSVVFVAARRHDVRLDLAAGVDRAVYVLPGAVGSDLLASATIQWDHRLWLITAVRYDEAADLWDEDTGRMALERLDEQVLLYEELARWLLTTAIDGAEPVTVEGIDSDRCYALDWADATGIHMLGMQVTYREVGA